MARFAALLALVAVMFGIAGLATSTESASALPSLSRFDIDCAQTIAPNDNEGVGEVTCTVTFDVPDRWSPPLPDTITVTAIGTYRDNDGNNRPSRGDRILCLKVIGPGGGTLFDRCRPGV